LFVGAGQVLHALRESDGTDVWAFDLGEEITPLSAPVLTFDPDSGVVITGVNGTVARLRQDDATVDWKKALGVGVQESLALGVDSAVYVPAADGRLRVLDKQGNPRCTYDSKGGGYLSAPALVFRNNRDAVYVADAAGDLIAFDGQTCQESWRVTLPAPASTPPAVTQNEIVYVGVGKAANAKVVALDKNGVRWSVDAPSEVAGLAVGEDGAVYAIAGTALLRIE
jgi:outer membrane protein assembly factor BamB